MRVTFPVNLMITSKDYGYISDLKKALDYKMINIISKFLFSKFLLFGFQEIYLGHTY